MAGHCIHIGPHEMELLRDTDTMVVTNPESNMGNAVGCPPAMRMFNEYGILMGLGTDGYTNGGMVTDTVINGEIRMRNREVQGIDEEKVWHDAQTQAQSFWKRVNQ